MILSLKLRSSVVPGLENQACKAQYIEISHPNLGETIPVPAQTYLYKRQSH